MAKCKCGKTRIAAPSQIEEWGQKLSIRPLRPMSKDESAPTLVGHSGVGVDIGGSFAKLVYFRYVAEKSTSNNFSTPARNCALFWPQLRLDAPFY